MLSFSIWRTNSPHIFWTRYAGLSRSWPSNFRWPSALHFSSSREISPSGTDSQQAEDLQDIEGHLKGGIPAADIAALQPNWAVCPQLRQALFTACRPGYLALAVDKAAIKTAIYAHPEFAAFIKGMNDLFAGWRRRSAGTLKALQPGCHPKTVIAALAEDLLAHYTDKPLIG